MYFPSSVILIFQSSFNFPIYLYIHHIWQCFEILHTKTKFSCRPLYNTLGLFRREMYGYNKRKVAEIHFNYSKLTVLAFINKINLNNGSVLIYSNHNEISFGCKSTNNQKPVDFCLVSGNEYQKSGTVADQAIKHWVSRDCYPFYWCF